MIRLPEGVVISELDNSDSVWPGSEYRTKELDFEGYTLDKFQRPTFNYSRGELSITDKVIPVASSSKEKPGTIRRILKFSGKKPPSNLYLRLAQGKFDKDQMNYVDEELFVSIKGGKVMASNDELRVPIQFNNETAELEITYGWAE